MRHRPLVLLVEDDRALRELYRVALTLSNFTVHTCEDGLDALHFIDRERPDVIVLDLNLPRLSGNVLYAELRAHIHTSKVPIVVVTGVHPVPYLHGATLLIKPVSQEQLIRVVEDALRRRERAWLFTKGDKSIRVTLVAESGQTVRLIVYGPGKAAAAYEDRDLVDALRRQSTIEQKLLDDGYEFLVTERRSGRDRRAVPRGPDRRRQRSVS